MRCIRWVEVEVEVEVGGLGGEVGRGGDVDVCE